MPSSTQKKTTSPLWRNEEKNMETVDILTLAMAAAALLVSIYTYIKSVNHDRKRDTLDAYNTLQEQALDNINNYTGLELKNCLESGNKELERSFGKWLARIEHFCVGVNEGIYDKKTVYELAHGYLDLNIWYKLQPLINKKQSGKAEAYYTNFEKVVRWMKAESEKKK